MIDQTPLDVRFAEHTQRVNRINQDGWQSTRPASGPSFRSRVAHALLARAGRLGLGVRPARKVASLPANQVLS